MSRTVAFVLADGAASERTATALRLASIALARGHRVTVFAHDEASALAAGEGDVPRAIRALLRRGLHGGTLDWVVDEAGARGVGVPGCQAPGVVPGDHGDLWGFVRAADVVLAPGGAR